MKLLRFIDFVRQVFINNTSLADWQRKRLHRKYMDLFMKRMSVKISRSVINRSMGTRKSRRMFTVVNCYEKHALGVCAKRG